jgi:phosphate transport system permease protein
LLLNRTQTTDTIIDGNSRPSTPRFSSKEISGVKLNLRKRFRIGEFIAENIIKGVSFTSFAVIILIFIFVFREAAPIFSISTPSSTDPNDMVQETYGEEPSAPGEAAVEQPNKSIESSGSEGAATAKNLLSKEWQPVSENPKYGILPLIVGSFKVTFIAVLFGAPIAILAALYTSFFAPRKLREFLKPTIEFLSGFPSVVIGFFALVILATLCQNIFGYEYRLNAFIGGIALSLATIPIVYSVTEDALSAVPKFMTEASLALGATKWQTALFVVLPAATPGVFAALLLGIGRAFGETMIVLMATGNAALVSMNFFEPIRTMSATVGAEMAEVVFGDTHYNVLFFIGSILFIFTFILNAVAEFYVRNKLQKRFQGNA